MANTSYSLGKTLLKIENVSLEYDGRPVLKNVNAEVRDIIVPGRVQGQVVGFLGPSGCGKTSLFHIIAGLNPPTSGRVSVNGRCSRPELPAFRTSHCPRKPHASSEEEGKGF